jgi:hypothetical protein
MTGLENLSSIGGYFIVDRNDGLTSMSGLESLTSIWGDLLFRYNDGLESLTGIENISASSIKNLSVYGNGNLSTCEVQSICDFLVSNDGVANIHDNAPGCNSPEEVELACPVSVGESNPFQQLLIYPNPSSTQITIELPDAPQKNTVLTIYNINGQQMLSTKITVQKTLIDISGLPKGIYFVKVTNEKVLSVNKLVKK